MKTIIVTLKEKQYPVYIDYSIANMGNLLKKHLCGNKMLVITDTNVNRFYSKMVCKNLKDSGKNVQLAVIQAGEQSKTIKTVYDLLKKCSLFKMDRTDVIVALGGGVVCDIAGFVASIYLRGIRFISIPTSLLAQVDASIGGKTAINLPWGKNLVGSFHQPYFVLMDFSTLNTLPKKEIAQGMAEVIKYAVIGSKKLFRLLNIIKFSQIKTHILPIVYECVLIKKKVVELDEKEEKGIREILNFGHTIGHAIEINSKKLNHGESISLGMIAETFLTVEMGYCSKQLFNDIQTLVKKFSLPVRTTLKAKKVADSLVYDKKMNNGKIRFVLPVCIGAVKTGIEIQPEEVIATWRKWQ